MFRAHVEVIAYRGSEELARFSLEPGSYTIGRSSACSLCVKADGVSREHARLVVCDDGSLSIEDLGSANGVLLNDEPIEGTVMVFPSQSIQLGAATLMLQQRVESLGDEVSSSHGEGSRLPPELAAPARYTIGDEIAQGGMGAILSARELATRRTVAMKVMLGDAAESGRQRLRFIEEAQITAQLEHPNIVPVHELGIDGDGRVFYTMKMVKGITVKKILDLLKQRVPETVAKYPVSALLTMLQKVCDAVAFAHSKGVLHRDLKPANIMVGHFGEVLVMDWGLAKLIGADSDQSETQVVESARRDHGDAFSTLDGAVMGTPQYMAPEQARGEIERLDARADVFALGAILYQLLTLTQPFAGGRASEVIDRILSGEAPKPPVVFNQDKDRAKLRPHLPGGEIPESLSAIAMKALAFAPEERYASVKALQADLAAYQNGFATSAEKAGAWKQIRLFVRRHRGISIATAAGLALLVVVSAGFTMRVVHERNVAITERQQAEAARATADAARADAERERRRAEGALADAQTQRRRAETALADFKAEQSQAAAARERAEAESARAKTEQARADTESERAKKAMGEVETQSSRAEAALADLKKTAPTFFALARARLTEGKFAEALEQIGFALRLDENSPEALLVRAEIQQTTGRFAEAIADYQRVLALRPGDAAATAALAVSQRMLAANQTTAGGSMLRLISWWKGDGNPFDSAGQNHATLAGGARFGAGVLGGAFQLDGKTGYASVPWSPAFALERNEFTLALWVNLAEIFGQQTFVATDGPGGSWSLRLVPGRLQLLIAGKPAAESAYFLPTLSRWHHVALVCGNGSAQFYVDGAKLSSEAWAGEIPATSGPLVLGHAPGRFYLSGMLDDVRIYGRALTPAELAEVATVPPPK